MRLTEISDLASGVAEPPHWEYQQDGRISVSDGAVTRWQAQHYLPTPGFHTTYDFVMPRGLTSLEGCPETVKGMLDLRFTNIESLLFSPKGSIIVDLRNSPVTSLKGLGIVEETLYFDESSITDRNSLCSLVLVGCQSIVSGNNRLNTLYRTHHNNMNVLEFQDLLLDAGIF